MKNIKKYLFCLICMLTTSLAAQDMISVNGVVRSEVDSEPLIGVMVAVEGTSQGVSTDINGGYNLSVPKNSNLIFSMIGFATQKHRVVSGKQLDVILKDDVYELDDVVVIGYGVVRKSDLTSSITSVKGKDLQEMTTGNAMTALQGKANGIQITGSGGPGATPRIIIRGATTLGNTNPLYVVDGVPISGNINFLNQNDIESMEVLKDASASAIYGTRAANGVILITTKKGFKGKTKFQFSTSLGFHTIQKPKIANAEIYEKVFKEKYTNDNNEPVWNTTDRSTDTDWWNEAVNKTALIQSYNLGFQGGNDKIIYSGSIGYYREDSQFDVGNWERLTGRFNTEYTFNSVVKAGIDFAPRFESWKDTPNLFGALMKIDPTTPIYKDESQWTSNPLDNYERSYNNEEWNPIASMARQNKFTKEYGLVMNPFISIEPIKGLIAKTQLGINARFVIADDFSPEFYIDQHEKNENSRAHRSSDGYIDWTWNNTVNYMKTIDYKHNLNLMGGFTVEKMSEYYLSASR